MGVHDHSAPLNLGIPKFGQPLTPQPVLGQCSSFFLHLPFPESGSFSCLPGPHKLEKGEVAMGRVVKVTPKEGLTVSFPFGKMGRVSVFHVSDSYTETPLEDFIPQKVVR